jgi:hypothetical protein
MSDYAHNIMSEDPTYNPFICRNSYTPTTFTETDYRLRVEMGDGCCECYVYDGEKDGLLDGYWVKTRLGYESMDESQIERMYLC